MGACSGFLSALAESGEPETYEISFFDYNYRKIKTFHDIDYGDSRPTPTVSDREGFRFVGWDSDEYEYVTQDAKIMAVYEPIGDYVTVTFQAQEGIYENLIYDWDYGPSDTFSIDFEVGHVLELNDIPEINHVPGGLGNWMFSHWSPADPLGYALNESTVFTTVYEYYSFIVDFCFPPAPYYYRYLADEGDCLNPREAPRIKDMVFIGWDSDEYLCVMSDLEINAIYLPLGDVNRDGELDTGDASMLLRNIVDDVSFDGKDAELADANCDGDVNTGDAGWILGKIAFG